MRKMQWLAVQGRIFSLIRATGPAVLGGWLLFSESPAADPSQAPPSVRQHADTSFDRLQQQERQANWPQIGGPRPGPPAL